MQASSHHRTQRVPFAGRGRRSGKVLVLMAVLLPSLLAFMGLVMDGGLLRVESRQTQAVADAAATAAAFALENGNPAWSSVAESMVRTSNGLTTASVQTFSPPTSGPYAGQNGFVEVILNQPYQPFFPSLSSSGDPLTVLGRAVAGTRPATAPAAIVVLDPDPPPLSLGVLPIAIPSLTPLLGGLEVLGLGQLRVNGAVHVNNTWGGKDEDFELIGDLLGLRNACSCMPLLPLTKVKATDVRVVGGVDNPDNYVSLQAGHPSPLQANRRPVPDPYASLPVPTTASDPNNVSTVQRGGALVVGLPLLGTITLQPGVYDWIHVVSGNVRFNPGVYVIKGVNPLTQIALQITAGSVQAEGVLFYITDSSYSASAAAQDADSGSSPPSTLGTVLPSVLIASLLLPNSYAPLNDPASPFHGLMIYQRRRDRRPILILREDLLGTTSFSGNVYAKWAHVIVAGKGSYQSAFACGSLRFIDVLDCYINPLQPLPAAEDVFLVE